MLLNTCLKGFLSLITVFSQLFCVLQHSNFFYMEFIQWLLDS